MNISDMSQPEYTAFIQTALRARGIETVLSGGSCVSIWSSNAYLSDDIDLIPETFAWRKEIRLAMCELGFAEHGRYFTHENSKWFVEFPAGPVTVGEERPKQILEQQLRTGVLRLLSPTDCVKDRLIPWLHKRDQQCLDQAVQVAHSSKVDVAELRRWVIGEGKTAATAFETIAPLLLRPSPEGV
jgi:hypothetical protein